MKARERIFDFYPLEDRILLSAEGLDVADVVPDADVVASLLAEVADAEGQPSSVPESNDTEPAIVDQEGAVDPPTGDPNRPLQVIFVDAGVDDAETLLAGLHDGDDSTQWLIVELAAHGDGIDQITQTLSQLSSVDAIHLLSHGDGTAIQLGNTRLDVDSAAGYAGQIASWADAIDHDADMLIYGCELAGTADGRALIESIGALCGCDVAASDDATGHELLGGDWDLEYTVGTVDLNALIVLPHWHGLLAEATVTTGVDLQADETEVPLAFEENLGQTDNAVDFLARGDGYTVFLADGDAVLSLGNGSVLNLDVVSSQTPTSVSGAGELITQSHYLLGDESDWIRDVDNFAAVEYENIYHGIDVRYYGFGRQLEYDFIVGAGADASQITLSFDSAESITISDDGRLVINLAGSDQPIHFRAPVSYQESASGVREAVESHYMIRDDGSVGFELGEYDTSRELVIDPILDYGTYLGGLGNDTANAVAVDAAGNAYITGESASPDFPATTGPFGTTGTTDVFVTKLSADGSTALFTTYLGGSGIDTGNDLTVDSSGNSYVVGKTASSDFPSTTGAFDETLSGASDGFVLKLSSDGSSIEYGSYIGSNLSNDEARGVAVDGSGQAYVTGTLTGGVGSLITGGAYQTTFGGGRDSYLAVFSADGSTVNYGTYFGGSGGDDAYDIAIDASGAAYLTGQTNGTDLPITGSAYQSISGGAIDAFVAKINPLGGGASDLQYSSYLGGTIGDYAYSVALDDSGRAYVVGMTDSTDFDVTAGAYDTTFSGVDIDAFLSVIDPNASGAASLVYSTALGDAAAADSAHGVAVDSSGVAWLTGTTLSASFPTTGDAHDSTKGGTRDAFITAINPAGNGASDLVYSTFLGGSSNEYGLDIALDASDNIYVVGSTYSGDFDATTGAYDETSGGSSDAFVTKFGPWPSSYGDDNTQEWITNVSFGDINNTSGADSGGYGNYSAQSTTITQGSSTDLSVTINPATDDYINAWVDWNIDGDFDDVGESFVVVANTSAAGPHNVAIVAPNDATIGTTRMRVSLKYFGAAPPTGMINWGEVEDYTVNIQAAPPSSVLWITTDNDVTSSGVTELANWTAGQVLEFGDPGLTLDPDGTPASTTDGTFSSTINLDTLVQDGDASVTAIHYVSRDITIGGGANTFDLLTGDVILSTEQSETLVGTNGNLAVTSDDAFVFRPTTAGDYSSGAFYFLLDGSQMSGISNLKGVSLVEQDTTVGDSVLIAGTFLVSDGGSTFDLKHFTATEVGVGTATQGTVTTLIDGSDINNDSYVQGVELIETATVIGETTLPAGSILLTHSSDDSSVGDNSIDVDQQDIYYLTVTKTEWDQTTSVADATLLFDGSDVALDATNEDVWGISLVGNAGDASPSDLTVTATSGGGLSLNEDGGNDAYLIADDGGAIIGGLDALTAEVRFAMDAFPNSTNFFSYATAGDDNVFKFNIRDNGDLSFSLNSTYIFSSDLDYRSLADGEQHTLSVTWDSSGGQWEMFVDGASVDSGSGFQSGVTLAGGGTLVMGNDQDSVDGGYDPAAEAAATLYDARIFNVVRSDVEIAANHQTTLPYDESGLVANWTFNDLSTGGIVTDAVSGNNLTIQHASGPGFIASSPELTLAIDENSANGAVVGSVTGTDAERDALIAALLAADTDLIYSDETGKFFKYVDTGMDWSTAQSNATSTTLNGIAGQLVTIRSATENDLVVEILTANGASQAYIGAADADAEGDWRWYTGAAADQPFWSGDGTSGSAVNDEYSNWNGVNPNDAAGGQDYAKIFQSTGLWDDVNGTATQKSIIEFGADEVLDNAGGAGEQPLTYSIQSQTVAGAFAIDTDSGEITVANGMLLDFETNSTHTLNIRVTDVGENTYDEAMTVNVNNIAPTILTATGSDTVFDGSLYTLNLNADEQVTSWTINWGDGSVETIAGNPSSVTHSYTSTGLTYNITASAADSDGMYHASRMVVPGLFANQQLFRLEATTGAVIDNIATGTGLGWAISTDIGPDGRVYVSSYTTDDIRVYDPVTSAYEGIFIAAGSGGLDGPAGIEFGPDGYLYVASNFSDEVHRYNGTTGAFIDTFVTFQSGGLDEPDDLTFGPDGNLYVTSFNTDEVLRYDSNTGAFLGAFVTANLGGLDAPSEVVFGPDSNLYVTSVNADQVLRYNGTTGAFIDVFASGAGLDEPRGAVYGPDGRLYVSGRTNMLRFNGTTGEFIDEYVPAGTINGPAQSSFVPSQQVTVYDNTVTVTTTSDNADGDTSSIAALYLDRGADGLISLREAIIATNNTANVNGSTPDEIHFEILEPLVGGAHTINASAGGLPGITDTIIIDASTDSDFSGTPIIVINGSSAGTADGLALVDGSDGSTIRGLVINNFTGDGIQIELGANGNTIAGNYIGVTSDGTTDAGNTDNGIRVESAGNVIGGTTVGDRNVISGNDQDGIRFIASSGANQVVGNYIGIDATGTADLGNSLYGVRLDNGGAGSVIGGDTAGERNVISGNVAGIDISGVGGNNITVQGNYVGTDATGTAALGNSSHGIQFRNAASNNLIGGTIPGEGNLVAYNVKGVNVWQGSGLSIDNAILGNTITANSNLGIDIGGFESNDPDDSDAGANDWLNFPVFTNVVQSGPNLDIDFEVDLPTGNYRIEFFDNPGGLDPSGFGEGEQFIGFVNITVTGAAGYESFSTTLTGVTASDVKNVTMTATEADGTFTNFSSTSEFGPQFLGAGVIEVTTIGDNNDAGLVNGNLDHTIAWLLGNRGADGEISLREAIIATNNTTNIGGNPDEIHFEITDSLVGGAHTIDVIAGGLPNIDDAVIIDGTSDSDFGSDPIIVLNGTSAGSVNGLDLIAGSDGSTIRGLVINRFGDAGIRLLNSGGHTVVGNWIGTHIDGNSDQGNATYGIEVQNSSGNTIGGSTAADRNVISGNDSSGISLWGATTDSNVIQGNYIGTNTAGTAAVGNTQDGINMGGGANANTIGGDRTAGEGNVISGNLDDGIAIRGAGADDNMIYGNYIGTNFDGTAAIGNARYGVVLYDEVQGNQIGGTGTGQGNIISGNDSYGIIIDGNGGSTTSSNVIESNYIGLNALGTARIANVGGGILVTSGANNNTVNDNVISGNNAAGLYLTGTNTHTNNVTNNLFGTNAAGNASVHNWSNNIDINSGARDNIIGGSGAGNVIAFSGNDGISIWSGTTTGNIVQGNYIGTNATGTLDLGNNNNGITISGDSDNNLIGGTNAGEGNLIAYNDDSGIEVRDNATLFNSILGNVAYENTNAGIDLGGSGVTTNDPGDGDLGPNSYQNFPVITQADLGGTDLTLSGTLDTDWTGTQYRIEFFGIANADADPSHGEGRYYLGTHTVTTNGSGDATFTGVVLSGVTLAAGDYVTATATKIDDPGQVGLDDQLAYGSTSELAANFAIAGANDPPTDITPNSFNVNENVDTTGGYSLGMLTTTDPDTGESFTYSIQPGGDGALFSIGGAGSDELIIDDGVLDFETKSSYSVNIRVTDSASNIYDETLAIDVNDVNEAPSVSLTPVVTNLDEDVDTSGLTVVATIAVNDDALGTESLTLSGADAALFEIVGNDLRLTAGAALDFETNPSLDVTVNVDDATIPGNPDDFAVYAITINDINEAPTAITPASFNINENIDTSSGHSLGVLSTTDQDTAETFSYVIQGGADAGLFSIGGAGSNELILTEGILDFESKSTYSVIVRVTDSGSNTYDQAITVNINDLNEAPTAIGPTSFNLNENADTTAGLSLGMLTTVDEDTVDTYTYSIQGGADAAKFSIGGAGSDELVLTDGVLDYETQASYSVIVRVTDGGSNTHDESISVTINDLNELPTDIAPNSFAINENTDTTGGYSLGVLTATDPDIDEVFTHSIQPGGDGALFSIGGVASDELVLTDGVIDFESKSSYSVNVRATDGASNTYDETLIVNVNDINEAPTVTLTPVVVNLDENVDTSSPTVVATIAVTDDALGSKTLGLSGADAALFEIAGTDLRLVAGAALDFETDATLDVTIEVDDGTIPGNPDDSDSLAITINDINEAPVVTLTPVVSILNEDADTSSPIVVATIAVTDDALGAETLSIGGADSGLFEIVAGDLRLVGGASLDFDTNPILDVTVNVDDVTILGSPDGSDSHVVTITDINEAPTAITPNSYNVAENTNTTGGYSLGILNATDPDSPETFTYSIQGGVDAAKFSIGGAGSDELILSDGLLDFESQSTYAVLVRVTDSASNAYAEAITVSVTDVNESPSVTLTPVVNNLDEDADTSSPIVVASIVVTDDALGAETLMLSGADAGLMEIVGSDLRLIAGASIDFETNAVLDVTVNVDDATIPGSPDDFDTHAITINDINEAPTAISPTGFNVDENTDTSGGYSLGILSTTDQDTPESFAYTIQGGPNAAKFSVGGAGSNELILTDGLIDFEAQSSYSVIVRVTDSGLNTHDESLTVNVNDLNDAPTVSLTPVVANLDEDADTSSPIIVATISVVDDALGGETLTLSGADAAMFEIAGSDLRLVAGATLDFETDAALDVTVNVDDAAIPGNPDDFSSYVVNVNDVNEAPTLSLTPVVGALNEDADTSSPIVVATIVVNDDALGSETFALSGADAALFEVAGNDLRLVAGAALDFESNPSLDIIVNVDDATIPGNPDDFGSQLIAINDVDEFDVGPISDTDIAFDEVVENAVGVTVGITAFATDPDGTNNTITYALQDDDGGRFVVDLNSGVVTTASALDREADGPMRNITIRATSTDGSFTDQIMAISILDVDEFDVGGVGDVDVTANAVAENAAIGTTVGLTASAADVDATNNAITYSLPDDDGGRFAIDAASGIVSVAGAIDREADGPSRSITVRATSADGSFSDQAFTINITDVDEFDVTVPIDVDGAADNVAENASIGMTIGVTASSIDLDATDNSIGYLLDDDDGGRFAIDPVSGAVTVAGAIDREADGPTRTITVRSTSSDGSLSTQSFTINIGDVDEFDTTPTTDSDPAANQVAENAVIGSTVGITASAADADATGNAISYSLDDNDGGRFAVDSATGVVTVAGSIDREADGPSRSITVRSTSTDGSFTVQSFVIAVADVDEFDVGTPIDTDASANFVYENAAIGTIVGITAFATDSDVTDSVSYWLDDDAGGRFLIDNLTGIVTVGGSIDFETSASHNITVRASSTDGSVATQVVTINVGDVNEAPVANDDAGYSALTGNPLTLSAPSPLDNDNDVDGDALLIQVVSGPTGGTLSVDAFGNLVYTPNPGFVGSDSITYQADDGALTSNLAVISIDVIVGGSGGGSDPTPDPDPEPKPEPAPEPDEDADDDENESKEESSEQEAELIDEAAGAGRPHQVSLAHAVKVRAHHQSSDADSVAAEENADAGAKAIREFFLMSRSRDVQGNLHHSLELEMFERLLQLDLEQAIVWQQWDQSRTYDEGPFSFYVGTAGVATGLFSVGYVFWALRGGAFAAALSSTLPAWRIVDPAALLAAYRGSRPKAVDRVEQLLDSL